MMYQCEEEHKCVNNQVGKTSIPDKFMCVMFVEVKGKIIRNQVNSYWVGVGSRGQEGIEGNILDPFSWPLLQSKSVVKPTAFSLEAFHDI